MGTHPRQRVRTLVVTTPANTAIAAAISTNWAVGVGDLEKVDIVIPSGHVGITGFQLLWGGRQVIPYQGAEFLLGNDDEITVELGLFTGSGTLVVRTYNLDAFYPHSHYLRAYLRDLALAPGLEFPLAVIPSLPDLGALPGAGLELPPSEEPTPEPAPVTDLGVLAAALGMEEGDLVTILDDILAELQSQSATLEEVAATVADLNADHDTELEALGTIGDTLAALGGVGAPSGGATLEDVLRRVNRLADLVKARKAEKPPPSKAKAATRARAPARRR